MSQEDIGIMDTGKQKIVAQKFGENIQKYDDVTIYPVVYEFPQSFKSKLKIKLFKPMAVRFTRLFLKLLGEGAGDCWFGYREILGVGKKKVK